MTRTACYSMFRTSDKTKSDVLDLSTCAGIVPFLGPRARERRAHYPRDLCAFHQERGW